MGPADQVSGHGPAPAGTGTGQAPGGTASDRFSDIERRLSAVERRLGALETESGLSTAKTEGDLELSHGGALGDEPIARAATHLGRILLIFGGAYLLRAITDYGFLPTVAGIPVGVVYALVWLYLGYRAAPRPGARLGAALYAGVSVLLVLPILVEAVSRFGLLSGAQSAVALVIFAVLALTVAVRRNLRSLAWLATAGIIGTSLVLLRLSGAAVTFCMLLLALGPVTLWLAYARHWRGLQWLGALGAGGGAILLAVLSRHEQWDVGVATAYYLAGGLWLVYFLSFVLRIRRFGGQPGLFEYLQAIAMSVVMGGVAWVAAGTDPGYLGKTGAASLIVSVGAYGLALSPGTLSARGSSYYFYSSLALMLAIVGAAFLLSPGVAAVLWALLAVGLAWLSGREDSVALSLHATILVVAAAAGSGALAAGAHAFAGATTGWPGLTWPQLAAAVAAVACLFLKVAQRSERWGVAAGLPQLVVLILSIWVVGGLMIVTGAPPLAGVPGPDADVGMLATLRTAVLAGAAVVLALSSRHHRWPEARWLAYPVIAVVGLKLIAEDFPNGRPLTLFMALGLVGVALILVSRLLARAQPAAEAQLSPVSPSGPKPSIRR